MAHVRHAAPLLLHKAVTRYKIPAKYLEAIENNQLTRHCCRNLVEHGATIELWKSNENEPHPDITIIVCGECNRQHRRFHVGETDDRRVWESR